MARYDGIAEWYDRDFLGSTHDPGRAAAARLLGHGSGRLLDVGCGTGAQYPRSASSAGASSAWTSPADMLRLARDRGLEVVQADACELPFEDGSFDAAVSLWTHTDVDEFGEVVAEVARVLRPAAPFVYVGLPSSLRRAAFAVHVRPRHPRAPPRLSRRGSVRLSRPRVSGPPAGLRAKVGAVHLTLESFLNAFLSAGLEPRALRGARPRRRAVPVRRRAQVAPSGYVRRSDHLRSLPRSTIVAASARQRMGRCGSRSAASCRRNAASSPTATVTCGTIVSWAPSYGG